MIVKARGVGLEVVGILLAVAFILDVLRLGVGLLGGELSLGCTYKLLSV